MVRFVLSTKISPATMHTGPYKSGNEVLKGKFAPNIPTSHFSCHYFLYFFARMNLFSFNTFLMIVHALFHFSPSNGGTWRSSSHQVRTTRLSPLLGSIRFLMRTNLVIVHSQIILRLLLRMQISLTF